MSTTTTEATYFEVAWGIEHGQSATWVDYGDDMAYSRDAEANATRAFTQMASAGNRVGFFVNGVLVDGCDFAAEWSAVERSDADAVAHKTAITLLDTALRLNWRKVQMVSDQTAVARCSCGWSRVLDTRPLARHAARNHREAIVALAALGEGQK